MSSYKKNNYGLVLGNIVLKNKPACLVELGVLHGYSTSFIAQALKEIKKLTGVSGRFDAYDLFEDYPYKHGVQTIVQTMLRENEVDGFVNLYKGDAYKVHKNYQDKQVDFLHVDISNNGQVVRDILELWHNKIRHGGIIVFEGGSEERDNIEWMKKYNKSSIKKELETNPIIAKHYTYTVHNPFPSITVLIKNNKDRITQLKALRHSILDQLIPFKSQENIGNEIQYFTADWWSIEVLTCLIEGKEAYLKMEDPEYLKDNKLWSRKKIAHYAEMAWTMSDGDYVEDG